MPLWEGCGGENTACGCVLLLLTPSRNNKGGKMSSAGGSKDECVRVMVRCRPLNGKEIAEGRKKAVRMNALRQEVSCVNPKAPDEEPKVFTFDRVYDETCTQLQIFEDTAKGVVDTTFEGYNGTIFAYGQTGAGKTHTMEGEFNDPIEAGLIPNSFRYIFERIESQSEEKQFLISVSYLEIYNENIWDLLVPRGDSGLQLKENKDYGVYVQDLKTVIVSNKEEMVGVLSRGKKNRVTGATAMNDKSSRSHAIFTINIEVSELGLDGEQHIRKGKFNLVDLAGSERAAKTKASGMRLAEGCKINLSLSALGNVISALVDKKAHHIPYRDSKLTRLLQDSLGGNTKTIMFANVGPADYNYDETMSTLRYANRAKQIKNQPRINEDPKDAMLRELQEQIKLLEARLAGQTTVDSHGNVIEVTPDGQERIVYKERIITQGVSEEELMAMREKSEEEKLRLLEEKGLAEEERIKALEELNNINRVFEEERQKREALEEQIEAMSGMVKSGGTLAEIAREQEEELRRAAEELESHRAEKLRLQQELEEQELERIGMEESYSSLEEKAKGLEKKLRLVISKYKKLKAERSDLLEEFNRDREDMLDTIRVREKEIMLKNLVIDNFIPPEEVKKIEDRATWDEENGRWNLKNIEFAGNNVRKRPTSAASQRRPVSEYAKLAASSGDPRFRSEDILNLQLDMPERSTQDYDQVLYDSHDMGGFHQAAGLKDVYYSYQLPGDSDLARPKSSRRRTSKRPGSSSGNSSSSRRAEPTPAARGLVQSSKRFI